MRAKIGTIAALFALLGATPARAQECGNFGSYLVGTFDTRTGYTLVQLVNPTAQALEVILAFFDDNERPLRCVKEKLSHNDFLELDVRSLKLPARVGVVKIVSHRDGKPVPGVVGFQRNYFRTGVSESNLASVPERILEEELKIIMAACRG